MGGFKNLKESDRFIVYKHTNKQNGSSYIGITKTDVETRKYLGYFNSTKFYYALEKYGWDNFETTILEEGLTVDEACEKEKYYIKKFDTLNTGYNLDHGGRYSTHSEESRKKISEAQRNNNHFGGHHHTEAWKKTYGNIMKNYWADPENRKRQSERLTGKSKPKEFGQHLRDYYNEHPEAREARRKASLGRKHTEKTKELLRNQWTQEKRDERAKSITGRKFVTDGRVNHLIHPDDIQSYLNKGFRLGKTQFAKMTEEKREHYRQAALKRHRNNS